MPGLSGKRIVVLESRMAPEMAGLVARLGGIPISAPAMQELPLPKSPEVAAAVQGVCEGRFNPVIFLTGVGARAFIATADALGKKAELLEALGRVKVVCRGPKPVAVFREHRVRVDLMAPEPHTSEDLLRALADPGWEVAGKDILVQHYGVDNAYLREALEARGGRVTDVSLYEWGLPNDTGPLEEAIRLMAAGQADAVAFTSQQQVRNLFTVAERMGLKSALLAALQDMIVVASVGPVATRTLAEEGVTPTVVPDHPKMGILVRALAAHFEGHPHPR